MTDNGPRYRMYVDDGSCTVPSHENLTQERVNELWPGCCQLGVQIVLELEDPNDEVVGN